MSLTGHAGGAPVAAPGRIVASLERAAHVIRALSGAGGRRVDLDVGQILANRAALLRRGRAGRVSVGGATRLLAAADGWFALSLARPSDLALVGALLCDAHVRDPWAAIEAAARGTSAHEFVARAQQLGVAAATMHQDSRGAGASTLPFAAQALGDRVDRSTSPPVVIDLSSLWAGPLCASILGRCGARVIKVESTGRPDGARAGPRGFFDSLHSGHESVALDFGTAAGRSALRGLIDRADIVIEASRPRALEQLGFSPAAFLGARPGRSWVSITGYGRSGPGSNRVAFGDDAAVAAGVVARDSAGLPIFCGDALADPISGLYAAAGALGSVAAGGGHLIDVAMVSAARHACERRGDGTDHPVERVGTRWWVRHCDERREVIVRTATTPQSRARPLGADTARVLAEFCS
jgi:hypothetical protein